MMIAELRMAARLPARRTVPGREAPSRPPVLSPPIAPAPTEAQHLSPPLQRSFVRRRGRVVDNGGGDRLGRWGGHLSTWAGRPRTPARPRAVRSATTGARGRRPGSRRRRRPRGTGQDDPCRRLTACANWRWRTAWPRSSSHWHLTLSCRRGRRAYPRLGILCAP